MIKIILIFTLFMPLLFSKQLDTNATQDASTPKNIWDHKNIWIKTYVNNKNYYTTINNIVKIEQKIKNNKRNLPALDALNRRLEIQKSKLALYEQNKSFNRLLAAYRFDMPEITFYDYFSKNSKEKLNRQIDRLISMKNEFNMAYSLLNNYYKKNKKGSVSADDLKYFEEFLENVNKTYLNMMETKDELDKKYEDYYQEKLQKHMTTLAMIIVAYIVYRLFLFLYILLEKSHTRMTVGFPQLQLDGNVLRDAEVHGPGAGGGWRAGRCRESSPGGQRKRFWLQGGPPWLPDHAGGRN